MMPHPKTVEIMHHLQKKNNTLYLSHSLRVSSHTLWLFNIAMENGPFIDGLPIKNGDFP